MTEAQLTIRFPIDILLKVHLCDPDGPHALDTEALPLEN